LSRREWRKRVRTTVAKFKPAFIRGISLDEQTCAPSNRQ
jgi:hypothetical protein